LTTAQLFRLVADGSGNERLERVQRARILWHGAQARPEPTAIDIVTRGDLEHYAMDMRYTAGEIVKELEREGLTKAT